jgi:pimeloyl-ACP methyl ester carboxylesterase
MATAGWRAVAIDLPGHGESEKPATPEAYTLDALTRSVRSACSALGIEHAVVVGHSMSGPIAVSMAMAQQAQTHQAQTHQAQTHQAQTHQAQTQQAQTQRDASQSQTPRVHPLVKALVLLAPVGVGPPGHLDVARRCLPRWIGGVLPHVTMRWMAWLALHTSYGEGLPPTARDLDEYWAPSRSPEFIRALHWLLHTFDWRVSEGATWRGVDLVDVPAIVLRGARDPLIAASGVEGYRRVIRGCVVEEVAGCGHAVPDESPERVVEAVLRVGRY